MEDTNLKKIYVPKIIAIIAFILTFTLLLVAIIVDISIVYEYILTFIFAIIASIFLFFIFLVAFVISCMLVFGVYLANTYGFWPINATKDSFLAIMGDAVINQEQISTFATIRIIILVLVIVSFILSIIALAIDKKLKNQRKKPPKVACKAFAIVALIFSIFGIIAGVTLLSLIQVI